MSRYRESLDEQKGMWTTFTCLQALRHGEDSVDADAALMILADFIGNVRGIASFFRKR